MPGPAKKADHLKIISGTQRADRVAPEVPLLPTLTSTPQPPDWLPNAHATKEWNRLAPILVKAEMLTDAGVTTLAHLCAIHGRMVQLYAAGESPTAHMVSQYKKLADCFCLTPGAAAKGGHGVGGSKRTNRFARFKEEA